MSTIAQWQTIGVGMLGYAFMGKAHSNAFKKIAYMTWPPPLEPKLVGIAGRNTEAVEEAARALRLRVRDRRLASARRGRVDRALRQRRPERAPRRADDRRRRGPGSTSSARSRSGATRPRATTSGRRSTRPASSTCARFNYRFVPAVRLAREMVEAGELGEIRHFRGRYLQDWGDDASLDTWRFDAERGRLGRARRPDGARRRPRAVPERRAGDRCRASPTRSCRTGEVDDAVEAAVTFENGSVGTLEATRFAHGRRNALQWEINGTKGSLAFDMERMNELQVFRADGDRARGFRTVLVSEADHPFWQHWWPPGHIIGWGDTFVHELHHLLEAIANDTLVAPYGATFEDGYRAAEICDAIVRSGESGGRETIDVQEHERRHVRRVPEGRRERLARGRRDQPGGPVCPRARAARRRSGTRSGASRSRTRRSPFSSAASGGTPSTADGDRCVERGGARLGASHP